MPGFWIPVWKNLALQDRVANMYFCDCVNSVYVKVGKELPTVCPKCEKPIPPLDK